MFKNVAAKFMVFAFDSATNLPKTGDAANITAYVSKDYGAVTVLADTSATEMDATNAKGYYLFDAAQGETNGDCLMVSAKSTTSGIVVVGAPAVIYTRPTTGWLAPTTAARTLDVSLTGEAGLDWANVGSPTTTNGLTGTTIATSQVVASVTGAVGSVTGAVGSVTGAVGSVTGMTASDVGAIKAKTDNLPASPAAVGSAMTLSASYDFAKGTVAVTESYAANGVAPSPVQALLAVHQMLMDFAIATTSYTVKKLDNTATAFVVTLNDATNPTSAVRT